MSRLPLIVFLALAATACGNEGAQPATEGAAAAGARTPAPGQSEDTASAATSTARRAVLARIEAYYADFSARDWHAFAAHFWPGATLTTVWQPADADAPGVVITGIDAFVDQAPAGPGSREIFEERLLGAEVTVRDGLAQVWARYAARFGDPGEVMEWSGIDAFTLLRHDGEWRIVSLSYIDTD